MASRLRNFTGQACGSSLPTSTSIGTRRFATRVVRRPDAVPRRGFLTRECASRAGRRCNVLLGALASFSFLEPRAVQTWVFTQTHAAYV